MATTTASNAILEVKVLFDISGTNPVINLTNQSEGNPEESPIPVLDNLTWVLNIFSPTGTPIYTSDFDTPFQTGVWTTAAITNAWPRPFGQIEWSGGNYSVEFTIKDEDGNTYYLNKIATICRPTGNTKKSADTFGQVNLQVTVECGIGQLYILDGTSKTYQGVTGNSLSSYLAVDYPRDPTGTLPAPFEITNFVTDALVPFTYNGNGYKASYFTVWEYDLGDNVFLDVRYVGYSLFNVQCNIDLCPLACEIDELIDKINTGRCDDVQAAKDKLFLINAKFNLAVIAKFNPTCGLDLPALIDEIKEIGGFSCDCSGASSGIGSTSESVSGLLFSMQSEGGDISGRFEQTGNNVVLYLKDKSYAFSICADSNTNAFEFRTTTNGTNKSVCLLVKESTLANELLNVIKNDTDLTNLFNSIVTNSGGILVSVDGKCVLSANNLTDYSWALTGIPASPSNAVAVSIKNNNLSVPINFVFNRSSYPTLQVKLNSLGLGTFVVTDNGSGSITITSASNSNTLSNLTYNTGSGNTVATQTNTSAGVQSYTVEQVLQSIIDYLSPIDETKISLSEGYSVPTITSGAADTIDVAASEGCGDNTTLQDLLSAFITAQTKVILYVLSLGGANCDALKAIFTQNSGVIDATSLLYGLKQDGCAGMTPLEVFNYMLTVGISNSTTKTLFCEFVSSCGAGLDCEVISFNVLVSAHDSACSTTVGIVGEWI